MGRNPDNRLQEYEESASGKQFDEFCEPDFTDDPHFEKATEEKGDLEKYSEGQEEISPEGQVENDPRFYAKGEEEDEPEDSTEVDREGDPECETGDEPEGDVNDDPEFDPQGGKGFELGLEVKDEGQEEDGIYYETEIESAEQEEHY